MVYGEKSQADSMTVEEITKTTIGVALYKEWGLTTKATGDDHKEVIPGAAQKLTS